MQIIRGTRPGSTTRREDTFTGDVWLEPVMPARDGIALNHVTFMPGARTYWHHHERGQLLIITAGRGLIGGESGSPEPIHAGDLIWTAPGERHWHGASPDSIMSHLAVSLGSTRWLDEVRDESCLAVTATP